MTSSRSSFGRRASYIFSLVLVYGLTTSNGQDILECTNNSTTSQSYEKFYLLDLFGKSGRVTADDITVLETIFSDTFDSLVLPEEGGCGFQTQATILSDAINGFGNDDSSNSIFLEQDFTFLMRVLVDVCQAADCVDPTDFFTLVSPRRRTLSETKEEDTPHQERTLLRSSSHQNKLRSLQDKNETSCSCFTSIPESEFLEEWQNALDATSIDSISTVNDLTLVEFEEACESDVARYASTVFITVDGTGMDSSTIIQQLGQVFMEAYNEVNTLNADLCDPHGRQILLSNGYASEESDTATVIQLYVAGYCRDCDSSTNLFDTTEDARLLQDEEYSLSSQQQVSCLCPTNPSTVRGPTIEEVWAAYTPSINELGVTVLAISEQDPFLCGGESVTFQRRVIVEFQSLCDVIEEDIPIIEQDLVDTYNTLISEYFCDPYSRRMISAEMLEKGNRTDDDFVTIEFWVEASCVGCDPDTISLYDHSGHETSSDDGMDRALQSMVTTNHGNRRTESNTCFCSTTAIANRAPREREFMDSFRDSIQSEGLLCVTNVARCNFGKSFDTALVFAFDDNTVTTDPSIYKSDLEDAVLAALTELYQTGENECDPEFRVFERVEAVFDVSFDPNEINYRQRQLKTDVDIMSTLSSVQPDGYHRRVQLNSEVPSEFPSEFPTVVPSSAPSNVPSSSPTYSVSETNVVFYVYGTCNGCTGDVISNSNNRVRQLSNELFIAALSDNSTNPKDSTCFCPINTTTLVQPNYAAVVESYNTELVEKNVSAVVSSVFEVNVEECSADLNSFDTVFSMNVLLSNTSESSLGNLTSLVEDTYNGLIELYCDPLDRQSIELTVMNISLLEAGDGMESCMTYEVTWTASGMCRGCEAESTELFQDADDDSTGQSGTSSRDRWLEAQFVVSPGRGKRRSLQASNFCFCVEETIAGRPPSALEFQDALDQSLNGISLDGVCGLVTPTESPTGAPTAEVCEVILSTELNTTILVTLETSDGMPLLDNETEALGQTLLTTYNELIESTVSTCSSSYRLASSVSADPLSSSQRRTLQAPNEVKHQRLRRAQEDEDDEVEESISILYTVGLICEDCSMETRLFDPEVLSEDEFTASFYAASEMIVNATFDLFHEVELLECDKSGLLTFGRVVIVEFGADCPDGISFDDELIKDIEDAYESTYNRLAQDYDDPLSRRIKDARVITIGANTTDGNIPLEISLELYCDGCDVNNTDVYGVPSISSSGSRRLLEAGGIAPPLGRRGLQDNDVCYVPSHPVAEDAPLEREFIQAYQEALRDFDLGCIQDVATCNFGDVFTTGLIADFEANDTSLLTDLLSDIELAFLETVEDQYQNDELTCNQDFVNVASVGSAILTDDDDGDAARRLEASDEASSEELFFDRILQTSSPQPSMSPQPSATPVPSPSPTFSEATLAPTPTVSILLYVSGVCNGCESDFSLSNDVIQTRQRRRQLLIESHHRQLQMQQAESNCFCQLGAVVSNRGPDNAELTAALNTTLGDRGVRVPFRGLETVPVADCTADTTDFQSEVSYRVSFTGDVDRDEIDTFSRIFKRTYNDLTKDYCDPRQLFIDTLQVTSSFRIDSGDGGACVDYIVEFEVRGTCRGCENGSKLFFPDNVELPPINRALLEIDSDGDVNEYTPHFLSERGLQMSAPALDPSCLCDRSTIANRAPLRDEFEDVLQVELEDANIGNVCGNSDEPIRDTDGQPPSQDSLDGDGPGPDGPGGEGPDGEGPDGEGPEGEGPDGEGPGGEGPGDGGGEGPGGEGPGDGGGEGPGSEGPGDGGGEGPGGEGPGDGGGEGPGGEGPGDGGGEGPGGEGPGDGGGEEEPPGEGPGGGGGEEPPEEEPEEEPPGEGPGGGGGEEPPEEEPPGEGPGGGGGEEPSGGGPRRAAQ